MAQFNLADYETVEQRIARFYKDYPDGRIITKNRTTPTDRSVSTWVVEAFVYLSDADQERRLPKATGFAFEIDGAGMANKTSALENAETSAIGRALANAGYSGNKRTSREEMAKVERAVTPAAPARPWLIEADEFVANGDLPGLRDLYNTASKLKVSDAILKEIVKRADGLSKS